jgi:hypothetical protein
MVAAKIATLNHGGDRVSEQAANLPVATQAEAAALLNVSERQKVTMLRVANVDEAEFNAAVERLAQWWV